VEPTATNPRHALQSATPSRQRVSMRHPGTFHLPWAPVSPTTSEAAGSDAPIPASPKLSAPVTSAPGETIAVKAAFEDVIVVFRISRDTSLADAGMRIADKLAEQGRPLSSAFALAYGAQDAASVVRPGSSYSTTSRPRSSSVSSVGDSSQLRVIASEHEWAELMTSSGPKITLRVLDSRHP
jgi:hypothetical protein